MYANYSTRFERAVWAEKQLRETLSEKLSKTRLIMELA